ncbi:MAG: hypothetical protein JRJ17_03805, partial [Deltaproteobacteria bacterium]|nr:hypothetical protein [Deltaproteobacteria bacterium]
KKLAEHLDKLPGGFPSTETGVELRILRRLFTPEEAEFALRLTLIPEEPRVIARRARVTTEEASRRLEEMAGKGLIFRMGPKRGSTKYMASQYVIGIWEYHVDDLDEGLIRDMNEYIPTLMNVETWKKAPQLRTIPVGRSKKIPGCPVHLPQGAQNGWKGLQKARGIVPCFRDRSRLLRTKRAWQSHR